MNAIKYGAFLVAVSLSTAAFAQSGDNVPNAAGPSGATSGQTGGAPAKLQERRSAKESHTNNPADAPTGVGGDPKALGTGRTPNEQGN
jgi:phage tail tape-measure protein